MSIQARLLKLFFRHASFSRKEPTLDNLSRKRANFEKIGRWMKPQKGSKVTRILVSGVPIFIW
jgi:hypothetical protein